MNLKTNKIMEAARDYVISQFDIDREYFRGLDCSSAINYLILNFKQQPFEQFGCIFLNKKYRIIEDLILFNGSINSAAVYPRIITQKTIELSAKYVLAYHNHPSGDPNPSQADIDLTRRIIKALGFIDVFMVDHIILAGKNSHSFLLNNNVKELNNVSR